MKLLKKETIDGKSVLTVQYGFFPFRWTTKYQAVRLVVDGYWEWVNLGTGGIVRDIDGLQFDSWNRQNL